MRTCIIIAALAGTAWGQEPSAPDIGKVATLYLEQSGQRLEAAKEFVQKSISLQAKYRFERLSPGHCQMSCLTA